MAYRVVTYNIRRGGLGTARDAVVVDVAVGVDPAVHPCDDRQTAIRGNSGAPLVTVSPPG